MKKLWLNIIFVFIAFQILGTIHHGYILKADYEDLRSTGIYRTQESISNHFAVMLFAQLMMSIAFVIIYRMGKETKPWLGQGFRYGFLISMVATIPNYLTYYSVEPLPGVLITKQIILDTVMLLITAILLARLEHPGQAAVVPRIEAALSV